VINADWMNDMNKARSHFNATSLPNLCPYRMAMIMENIDRAAHRQ
jgi:hypothetical protein